MLRAVSSWRIINLGRAALSPCNFDETPEVSRWGSLVRGILCRKSNCWKHKVVNHTPALCAEEFYSGLEAMPTADVFVLMSGISWSWRPEANPWCFWTKSWAQILNLCRHGVTVGQARLVKHQLWNRLFVTHWKDQTEARHIRHVVRWRIPQTHLLRQSNLLKVLKTIGTSPSQYERTNSHQTFNWKEQKLLKVKRTVFF